MLPLPYSVGDDDIRRDWPTELNRLETRGIDNFVPSQSLDGLMGRCDIESRGLIIEERPGGDDE